MTEDGYTITEVEDEASIRKRLGLPPEDIDGLCAADKIVYENREIVEKALNYYNRNGYWDSNDHINPIIKMLIELYPEYRPNRAGVITSLRKKWGMPE